MTRTNRGWWRRNLWGLLLVLPLLAGLFAFNADTFYERNYAHRPKAPVPVNGTGLATLDDYGLRVIELKPVDNPIDIKRLVGFSGETPPGSARIWRLLLSVDAPTDDKSVTGCAITLEDAAGRQYALGPSELSGGPTAIGGGCYPDDEDQPRPWTATTVYLLPADARPVAVRIVWADRLPRYIRFPVATP